jgi:hypothetical protein
VTIPASAIAKLAALGLNAEQASAVADVIAEVEAATMAVVEAGREKARNRMQRWRETHAGDVTKRNTTSRNATSQLAGADARVEDKTSTQKIEPLKKDTHAADLAAFKAALAGECDPERIDAFVKLRKTKRGQNTGHAADLFKRDAAACGLSVPQAIDTCISRNWLTVKPEFLAGRQQRAGPTVVPMKDSAANAARRRIEALQNAEQRETRAVDDLQQIAGLLPLNAERARG